jgi:Hydrazine synthase alpha subunit middle domain
MSQKTLEEAVMKKLPSRLSDPQAALAAAVLALGLAGCSGNGSSESTVAVAGDVPIAYAKRVNTLAMNPTDGTPFAAGGDLIIREKSSASAPEHNVTAQFTQGNGDVADPEVSYDGKKIVFAMRCPTSNTTAQIDGAAACTGRWNIWEYTLPAGGFAGGSFRRITASTADDDVDPYYLPGGKGFVFASNRQTTSAALQGQALGAQPYFALDEYERERVLNLHTMNTDGGNITQISVNQSHDRNPVVRENGNIMFSRWEHVGPKNRFAVFQVKPDGTDMFVFYGALSPGNSFLHPREMDPKGPYKGQLASSLMSLSGTQEGGALMLVDAANYSEHGVPASALVTGQGGQRQFTQQLLNDGRGLSRYGRVTSPYPLWDGTNRMLISYRPCEVTKDDRIVSCATLSDAEVAALSNTNRMRGAAVVVQGVSLLDDVPASYAVYMYDPQQQTQLIVAAPPPGFMYVDPIALQPRAEPQVAQDTLIDTALKDQKLGLVEVRSVYDTDGLDRMGESMLTAGEQGGTCSGQAIKKTAPTDTLDTRQQVADLKRIKDPADVAYQCAPARFVRAFRAVAPPSSGMGLRSAIGETEFEQQQILGYAPVEPDGSFKLHVPADTPLGLAIIDAKGRAIQTHLNWIQVRPGERRTCDGCHSPRRGASLNSGQVANAQPAGVSSAIWNLNTSGQITSGETMASKRVRLYSAEGNPLAETSDPVQVQADMVYRDIWADPAAGGVARQAITLRYTGNASPADNLATPAPTNGLINYPQHIAVLWTRDRGANTCTGCHYDPAKLDLSATTSGTGRLTSYEELLVGDPVIDAVTGLPQIQIRDGEPEVVRGAPLVETMAGNALGMTRASRLGEILFGEELKASAAARTAHPNPPAGAPNHAAMLNRAELRLVSEWMDLGGQYFNNPFDGGVQAVAPLSQASFEAQVLPILNSTCAASCHQAGGTNSTTPAGTSFLGNRFVLTGSAEGDYGVTLSMISDTCTPAANFLLMRPSTVPHPSGGTAAVLPVGSASYNVIANWILGGCTAAAASSRSRLAAR